MFGQRSSGSNPPRKERKVIMTPEEKLAALLAEGAQLKEKSDAGTLTVEDGERAIELAKERAALEDTIARKKAATAALAGFGAPVQDNTDEAPDAPDTFGQSLGEVFTGSEAYKAFKAKHPSGVGKGTPIDIKTADPVQHRFASKHARRVGAKADPINTRDQGNAAPVRTGEVDDLVYRPERRLLDLITRGTTGLSWFEYRQIISKTNNAAIVSEATTSTGTGTSGGVKPLSTLTTRTADAKAYTYADGMEVTNQELSDDGVMQTLIDQTLTENLEIELENILLNGEGSSDEPAGILHTSGVLHQSFDTDMPTSIRKAMTKLRRTSGTRIGAVLLNPEDDEAWDLLKDNDGRYLGAGPFSSGPSTAWGRERIDSEALDEGQAIIGDFRTIHLLQREALQILAFNQHKDYAQRNLTYIRAELRALQLVRNAARLCVVDLVSGD